MDQHQDNELHAVDSADKRPYSTPQLRQWGRFEDMTLAGMSLPGTDFKFGSGEGGGPPA